MEGALDAANSLFQTINWSAPTWDLFIWIFFIVAAFLYGISLGRDRIIVIMVGLYMALAIVGNTPFLQNFTAQIDIQGFGLRFSIFVGLFIIFFFILSRSALSEALDGIRRRRRSNWAQATIMSVLHVGLLISIVLSFLPADALTVLTPFTRKFFLSDMSRFLWLILPVVAMILFQEGHHHRRRRSTAEHE